MENSLKLLVHGRGNAWPVFLGERHPFYDHTDYRDLANAAFSLVATDKGVVSGDILVDAGHGTVQSLLSGVNRIPDCICLTHGHMDHTLGVDWVVQSYWKLHQKERRYPVYATMPVYRFLIRSYPQLEEIVEFRELVPGRRVNLDLKREIAVTGFPVYHGTGAVGASMLLFETGGKRVLFTGDLITPLLRKTDYDTISDMDLLVVDSNNRFPWPRTNHWSFAGHPSDPFRRSDALNTFIQGMGKEKFTEPHLSGDPGKTTVAFLEQVMAEWNADIQPFTVLEFLARIRARRVVLVHYSGTEDQKHYGESILSAEDLRLWVTETAARAGSGSGFIIPEPGEEVII